MKRDNVLNIEAAYSEVYKAIMDLRVSRYLRNFLVYCAGCIKEGSTYEELVKLETASSEDVMHWLNEDEGVWSFRIVGDCSGLELSLAIEEHIRNYLMSYSHLFTALTRE